MVLRPNRDNTIYLLGTDYFIFEPPNEIAPVRTPECCNVLISMGGSDPTGKTIRVLEALLAQQWPETVFRVILGPGFNDTVNVRNCIEGRSEFVLCINPPDLLPYLLGCDWAVCAGGRTLYELTCLGKAVLAVATTPIEADAVRAFKRRGLIAAGLSCWHHARFSAEAKSIWKQSQGLAFQTRDRVRHMPTQWQQEIY